MLVFSKVLDVVPAGLDEEDVKPTTVTRKVWVEKASEQAVSLAEEIEKIFNEIDDTIKLNYTKMYI